MLNFGGAGGMQDKPMVDIAASKQESGRGPPGEESCEGERIDVEGVFFLIFCLRGVKGMECV